MAPVFSVITVTYNASSIIDATLRSVAEQTFTDYEHIVVDGASKDDTLAKVQSSGIKNSIVVSEPDKGIYDAMNKAINMAHGEFLIFLNAGDSFARTDTLYLLADTAKRTHADVLYGQTQLVDSTGKVVGKRHLTAPSHLNFKSFGKGMLVCHQAFVARRKIAPLYDMRYRYSADYEWCIRILKRSTRNAYCGDTIINFLTGGTTTQNHKKSLKERFHIMCYYYGFLPTIVRHIGFIPRFLVHKWKMKGVEG